MLVLDNVINNLKDDIVRTTQELIRIPSVYQKSDDKKMPFLAKVVNFLELLDI